MTAKKPEQVKLEVSNEVRAVVTEKTQKQITELNDKVVYEEPETPIWTDDINEDQLRINNIKRQQTMDPRNMANMQDNELEEAHGLHQHEDSFVGETMEEKAERKKHNRRTAKEIARQYICPYRNCGKIYGSDGSLNLHIKIKHNGGSKTDREKLAKTIIVAFMKGNLTQVIDKIDLNLPPGTISKAAKKYGLTDQVENQVLQQIYQRLQTK